MQLIVLGKNGFGLSLWIANLKVFVYKLYKSLQGHWIGYTKPTINPADHATASLGEILHWHSLLVIRGSRWSGNNRMYVTLLLSLDVKMWFCGDIFLIDCLLNVITL